MRTSTWIVLAAAVLALVLFITHRSAEGMEEKSPEDQRQEKDDMNTRLRYGAECHEIGKFWNRERKKCMDIVSKNEDGEEIRNCKGTVDRGWCFRTKDDGKLLTNDEFDELVKNGTKKCKKKQLKYDPYKGVCFGVKEIEGLCPPGTKWTLKATGLYSCVGNEKEEDVDSKLKKQRETNKNKLQDWRDNETNCLNKGGKYERVPGGQYVCALSTGQYPNDIKQRCKKEKKKYDPATNTCVWSSWSDMLKNRTTKEKYGTWSNMVDDVVLKEKKKNCDTKGGLFVKQKDSWVCKAGGVKKNGGNADGNRTGGGNAGGNKKVAKPKQPYAGLRCPKGQKEVRGRCN